MNFNRLNVSVKGPGHLLCGLPNQDASYVSYVPSGWLAVVCDGMGSKPYSQIGARQACRAVADTIKKSSFSIGSKDLIKAIYQLWLTYLGRTKPNEAVTTCLFCWLSHEGEARTFQLGDGLIIISDKAHDNAETNSFGNETTGLGKSTKFSDWNVTDHKLKPGDVVALMTDGISEDIYSGMEMEFLYEIYKNIENKSIRQAKFWLKNEFRNWATPNHQDDKSLALLVLKK